MAELLLKEAELDQYRLAVDIDAADLGPALPRASFDCMQSVLKQRGIHGTPEKVTVEFVGYTKNYYLHYEVQS